MTIREATPNDAEQILNHVVKLTHEPDNLIPMAPGEFTFTVEQEQKLLANYATADNFLFLVAVVEHRKADAGTRISNRGSSSTAS